MNDMFQIANEMNKSIESKKLSERLMIARNFLAGRLVFTTSFGLEDQILSYAIAEFHKLDGCNDAIEISTLDTGRLFPETYDVWSKTVEKYGLKIKALHPDSMDLSRLVEKQGVNGFYESVENRKNCCFVRKVAPLEHALKDAVGWITGLRSGQSTNRKLTLFAEVDSSRNLIKINPLFDWDRATLVKKIEALNIPYNKLHDAGFLSIGCQPCTRAVRIGEEERDGRWSWEKGAAECGLHNM